jgi:DNA polymerase III subunit epsilon
VREIILDTETTGLDPKKGDRVIEIGCIEIYNRIPTGREYHAFINPLREVPAEAQAVHGLSTDFLKDKPVFAKIGTEFLKFIGDEPLVIHNASFDISFLNFELGLLSLKAIAMDRVVDTLALARRKHPSGPNNLDALCKRYGIDLSKRTKHGALIDCLLLAEVYVELLGERQAALGLQAKDAAPSGSGSPRFKRAEAAMRPEPLPPRVNAEAVAAHRTFIGELGPKSVWLKYWGSSET